MEKESGPLATNKKLSTFERIERLHPHELLLYLGLFGSGLIFLFLVTAFLVSAANYPIESARGLPMVFYFSSIVILLSSGVISRVYEAYDAEDMEKISRLLWITFGLGLIFTVLQASGWKYLSAEGISFTGAATGSYLYLLSGVHMAHILGGMIMLGIVSLRVSKNASDPVRTLIYVTNPYEKLTLRLLNYYWHFMDVLWLLLLIAFYMVF